MYTLNGNYSYIISLTADKDNRIRIYPSPAKTDVSVNGKEMINTFISIIDTRGAEVKRVLLTVQQQQVQLGGLPAGIYYFRFANNKVQKIKKE